MKASEKQVGGTHYRTAPGGLGHWDYCVIASVPYLEGCASKYLTRWRDKGGLQDLEKAIHYLERRLEAVANYQGVIKGANKSIAKFEEFLKSNSIPELDAGIIDIIMHWKRPAELACAIHDIEDMIKNEKEDTQFQREIAWSKSQEGC